MCVSCCAGRECGADAGGATVAIGTRQTFPMRRDKYVHMAATLQTYTVLYLLSLHLFPSLFTEFNFDTSRFLC